MSNSIVIIGGGLAAASAAHELRKLGHGGSIDLVTGEAHRPHERPPLSKGYMLGKDELSVVFVGPDDWQQDLDVTLHVGQRAERIHDGLVTLDDGTALPYDRLLIATGLTPRALDVPGAQAKNVHTFRTIDDAEQVRAALEGGGKRVVCIGSGWIALELAAAARHYDNDVTVVSHDDIPLSTQLGTEMGLVFKRLHEENGVKFLLERDVEEIEGDGGGSGDAPEGSTLATSVRTDRETVAADLVIVGIGATPNTAIAETANLELDHGILVNERMETSVPGIYAAGDVVNALHPTLGERLRSEHWAFAIASGEVAASSMTGGDTVLDDIPYFFTDQYDLGMEYSGFGPLANDAELVTRGDVGAREFIAFWLAGDNVVAGMNVNVWDVNEEVQRLIRDRVSVTAEQLRDENVSLGSLT